jgi:hypothetical protein
MGEDSGFSTGGRLGEYCAGKMKHCEATPDLEVNERG